MIGLTFDEAKHEYAFEGKHIPSVTQVLQQARVINPSVYAEGCAERGTFVHKAIKLLAQGTLDWNSVPPEVNPYVTAADGFLEHLQEAYFNLQTVEEPFASRNPWFAGTPDITAVVDGDLTVIDFKTGQPEPWHRLQLAGYKMLTGATAAVDVYLKPDGTYITEWLGSIDQFYQRNVFVACLQLADWYRRENG